MCNHIILHLLTKGVFLWLSRLYSKIVFSIAIKSSNQETLSLGLIEALNPLLFSKYDYNEASLIKLVSIYPSIYEYTKKLDYCVTIMKGKGTIPNSWCNYDYREIRLSELMTNKKFIIIFAY